MQNIFDSNGAEELVNRVNALTPKSIPQWGKMSVDQMLAHCNVAFDMAYTDKYPKAGSLKKIMLKLLVKNAVVGPKPYPKNGRTAPEFIIEGSRDFNKEKQILVDYIKKTNELGASSFEGRENINFGALSSKEWNTMFSKHLDHHFNQFGV